MLEMWKRRNRELATLGERCLQPLTLPEWLALCVAAGAFFTMFDPSVEHGSPPVNIVHDNAVYIGEGSVSWAGTTPTSTSGTTYYFNSEKIPPGTNTIGKVLPTDGEEQETRDRWLDCSQALTQHECVARDFPKP
jgi:hypothetical protein